MNALSLAAITIFGTFAVLVIDKGLAVVNDILDQIISGMPF